VAEANEIFLRDGKINELISFDESCEPFPEETRKDHLFIRDWAKPLKRNRFGLAVCSWKGSVFIL